LRHWGLDFVTLEVIAAAAEEGSISSAAKLTHLALAAASRRITEFERHIGVQVFERRARGVRVTLAGRPVLSRIQSLLAGMNNLSGTVEDLKNGVTDHLSLLANTSVILQFLPEVLARFVVAHPHVRVDVEEMVSSDIVEAVVERRGSLGVTWRDIDIQGLVAVPLGEDELTVIVPRRHALAKRRSVRFSETLAFDFVAFEAGSPLFVWFRREAGRLNRVLRARIQVRGFDALCRMVEAGLGIGIAPRGATQGLTKSMNIVLVRLNEPWAHRRFSVVYRSAEELATVERSFVSFIEEEWQRSRPQHRRRTPGTGGSSGK
jgi:DNA-binding transcriptional LysR family regulator